MGVFAPASKFTIERAKPPVTGKPPLTAAAILAVPKPTNSWSGSIRSRRFAAKVCATETDSTKPTKLINKAAGNNSMANCRSIVGSLNSGKPSGISPTTCTPALAKSPKVTAITDTIIVSTGPVLVKASAQPLEQPKPSNSPFRRVRTSCKNTKHNPPIIKVGVCTDGSCATSEGNSSNTVCPCAWTPKICFSWLSAISKPEALIKPEITG